MKIYLCRWHSLPCLGAPPNPPALSPSPRMIAALDRVWKLKVRV